MSDVFVLIFIATAAVFCIVWGVWQIFKPRQTLRAPDPMCFRNNGEFVGRDWK